MQVILAVLLLLLLLTCRPAEPQRPSSTRFNPSSIRPAPLSFTQPLRAFSLNPGLTSPRRHARASASAPNYIPAKAFYKGASKRLWNGEEQSGTLRKHLMVEPRQQSVWPRCWSACDHLMRPGVEGGGGGKRGARWDVAWSIFWRWNMPEERKTKFSSVWTGGNMRLFPALSQHMWEDALALNSTFAELRTLEDTES